MVATVNNTSLKALIGVIIGICLAGLILVWPVFFEGTLFSGLYVPFYHYIFFSAQHYLIFDLHTFPHWWPQFFSGYPIDLTLDGFLNPLFILSLKYFSTITAYHILTYLFIIANALSMYWFARVMHLSSIASFVVAITFMTSGIVIRWTDVIVFIAILPLLPLSCIACVRIMEGRYYWMGIWALLLAYAWIGGFSELMVYFLVGVGLFAVYLCILHFPLLRTKAIARLGACLGVIIVSLLLVSWWIIPVFSFITSSSNRAEGVSTQGSASMPTTLSHIIHMVHPRVSVYYGDTIPYLRLGDDIDLFMGAMSLFLLIFGIISVYVKRDRYGLFFLFLALFAFILTLPHSPLFSLLHMLPVVNWFRWQWKWTFLTMFSLSLIAGYGADYITSVITKPLGKRIVKILSSLLILVSIILFLITVFQVPLEQRILSYAQDHYGASGRVFTRSPQYYHNILVAMTHSLVYGFSLMNPWVRVMLGIWIAVVLGAWWASRGKVSERHMRWGIVILTFFSCTLPWFHFFKGPSQSYLTTPPQTAVFLRENNKEAKLPLTSDVPLYRVGIYVPSQAIAELQDTYQVDLVNAQNRMWFDREMLDQNLAPFFGIDSLFNHEPLGDARLQKIYFHLQDNGYTSTSSLSLLRMMNVKYVLSAFELPSPWKKVFTSYAPYVGIPVYIYEINSFMPRWYFAQHVLKSTNEDAFVDLTRISDFSRDTLIQSDKNEENKESLKDTLSLIRYTAGSLSLATHTESPRYVVLSETYAPGWRARVDGMPVPTYRANYVYQAVRVPSGEHRVEFYYSGFFEQTSNILSSWYEAFIH